MTAAPTNTLPGGSHASAATLLNTVAADRGSTVRDLDVTELSQIRTLFEDTSGLGLFYFAWYVCGLTELRTDLHLEVCRFLSRWGQLDLAGGVTVERPVAPSDRVLDNWRRLHLCVPRDCFKTTLATRTNSLWQVTRNPDITIGIFNESEAKVKQWVGAIKQTVERSVLFQLLWPHLLPPGIHFADRERGITLPRTWKWGDSGLLFQRNSMGVAELTIEPFGIGGASTGKHFSHIIKDDIIGESSAQSAAVMSDAIHWADHARDLEKPAQNGCELVCYTRWAYHDVYSHMLKKWPKDYKVYKRHRLEDPATGEPDILHGESIFPERMSTQQAREMWERDPFQFSSQQMCIPLAGRETAFQRRWVRTGTIHWDAGGEPSFHIDPTCYDPEAIHPDAAVVDDPPPNIIPLAWMSKVVLLDPAPSRPGERAREPKARNGIVIAARDPWGRTFLYATEALREDPVTVLDAILAHCHRWGTDTVAIEEVNFSTVYAPLWREILRGRRQGELNFLPLHTHGQDKDVRIRALMGPFKQGLIYLNEPECGPLIQELLEYPYSETRDLVDALAYHDQALSRPLTHAEEVLATQWRHRRDLGRDPHTGY